ncbi:MAG TPA: protein kinase [Thermoanaerobaculia bacterium]|nr:protein kinase [Thermoanaerobaculia bacterium]
MPIPSGSRLGPYEIESPLGAGGMGEVYRARDTRLSRSVAIKVLPEALSRDPERAARFEREARSASALSHAHVVVVYDVGRSEDSLYLVTEIVEGGDLRGLLSRERPSLRRAVDLAVQISSGLAAAHESGVVHRDLKPENVLIGRNGEAKIGDFGLAKLTEGPGGSSSHLPTSDGLETSEGIVMGTVAYMSPEQARGDAVDFRSDQFAFGSLLYEMLSGRPSFRRASAAETLSAIIRDDPEPLRKIDPSIPPNLSWIVERCLAKEPRNRYASTRDLASDLELVRDRWSDLTGRVWEAPGSAVPRRSRTALLLAAGIAVALTAAALVALMGRRGPPAAPPGPIRFTIPPPAAKFVTRFDTISLAFSPDGSRLAFIADETESSREVAPTARPSRKIWVRNISDLEARPVAGTEGAASIFWSPDGRSIGFIVDAQLRRQDLGAGAAVSICDVPSPVSTVAGSWGAGVILFASTFEGIVYRVPADGAHAPEPLIRPDRSRGETRVGWPHFLPDGRSFLYVATRKDGAGHLMFSSLDSGAPREVGLVNSRVEYADPGFVVFARDGALVAQRFDPKSKTLAGPLVSLAPSVHYFYTSKWAGFTVSRTGSLAWQPQGNVSLLTWFDRSGKSLGEVGSPNAGDTISISISPDGRDAAFDRTRSDLGTFDVWRIDLSRGVETRLTSDPNTEFDPVWLPDGRHLVYSVVHDYLPRLVRRDLASALEEPLLPEGTFQQALDVTSDGRRLLFSQTGEKSRKGIWMLSLNGPASPVPLVVSTHTQDIARLSPDGRFVAYISDESGRPEAYVAQMGASSPSVRVSPSGAVLLRWSRDGSEIFYTSPGQQLFSASVATSPSLQIGAPRLLFSLPPGGWRAFDVAADGRFLASVPQSSYATQPLRVALNWTSEVPK